MWAGVGQIILKISLSLYSGGGRYDIVFPDDMNKIQCNKCHPLRTKEPLLSVSALEGKPQSCSSVAMFFLPLGFPFELLKRRITLDKR